MELYIKAYGKQQYVDLDTYLILSVLKASDVNQSINVLCITQACVPPNMHKTLSLNLFQQIDVKLFDSPTNIPKCTSWGSWPILVKHASHVVCGLCAVCRQIIKHSDNKAARKLLGFRENCLMCCAGTSNWTRFCEIDLHNLTENVLTESYCSNVIPKQMARLEYHLSQPVKIHNQRKVSQDLGTTNILHLYLEGPYMTLVDVIVFLQYQILFTKLPYEAFPKTYDWYKRMIEHKLFTYFVAQESLSIILSENVAEYEPLYAGKQCIKNVSTDQKHVNTALDALFKCEITSIIHKDLNTASAAVDLDVPLDDAIPSSRASRKHQQIRAFAMAVSWLTNKNTIVDFCSGGGHVGLVLAHLIPESHVLLVDNKEESVRRAEQRMIALNLKNVSIIQSNLEYFMGEFDVGVSLHACGSATDLVLLMCQQRNASFVCCPCCYGAIKDSSRIHYPRSRHFVDRGLQLHHYLTIAHAADQTHLDDNAKTKQGYQCMDVIDTDRLYAAKEHGYKVTLSKLKPNTCTFKNNLLIGEVYRSAAME